MNDHAVLGQRIAMNSLRASIVSDRVAHAYLFVGPDGVGKSLAAYEFAKALNCTEQTGEPCNTCDSCRKIDRRVHPDVILIEPASATRVIKTNTIKQLIEAAAGTPLEAKRKVFIIIGADRMNLFAANRFLKTLEEPPGNCVFILVTSRPSVLPATVASRCQWIKFATLPKDVVEDILVKKHAIDPAESRIAARLSNGQASRALDFALTDRRSSSLEIVRRLMNGEDPVALAVEIADTVKRRQDEVKAQVEKSLREKRAELSNADVEKIAEYETARVSERLRAEIEDMLGVLIIWCRDVLVIQSSDDRNLIHNFDIIDEIEDAARQLGPNVVETAIDKIGATYALFDANIQLAKLLRRAFMSISKVGRSMYLQPSGRQRSFS